MSTLSISRRTGGKLLGAGLTISIAGLIMVLSAPVVYAQSTPTGETKSGQSSGEQYKRGETPTGQPYGVIKEGEPHKSDAGKKMDRSDDKQGAKGGAKPEAGSGQDKSKTP
jgi:hypothetical protein